MLGGVSLADMNDTEVADLFQGYQLQGEYYYYYTSSRKKMTLKTTGVSNPLIASISGR
jgi:hypothetical protein